MPSLKQIKRSITTTTNLSGSFNLYNIGLNSATYLSWDSVQGAGTYQIQKYESGNWVNIGNSTLNIESLDTSLINGEQYSYRIVTANNFISNTTITTPEVYNIVDPTIYTPVNFRGFCVGSNRVHLTWRKGGVRDKVSYEIQWKNNNDLYQNLTTIEPVVCNQGIYGVTDPIDLRRVETNRYFKHNFTGLTGTNTYRIRTKYQDFYSTWSSEIVVPIQGVTVSSTASNLATVYNNQPLNSGNVVNVSGNFTFSTPITLRPGVSITTDTTSNITFDNYLQYSWDEAMFKYNTGSMTNLNLELSNINLNGSTYTGRAGISVSNVRGLIVDNVDITDFHFQGIGLGINIEDSVIKSCIITRSGYSPPIQGDNWAGGEGGAFIGNIVIRGDGNNVLIYDNIIDAENRGYGIKCLISFTRQLAGEYYNEQFDIMIFNNTITVGNRLWDNASPQFSIEFWKCDSINNIMFNNSLINAISVEHRNTNRTGRFTVRVSQNYCRVNSKACAETSNHDIWIDSNIIDLNTYTGGEEIFADYNRPGAGLPLLVTENLLIEKNLVYAPTYAPIFLTHRNSTLNCRVRNNTYITNDRFPYAFINYRTNDDGSFQNTPVDLFVENNSITAPANHSGTTADFLLKLSTDSAGGGFLPFNTGRLTVNGTCSVRGNICSQAIQLLPVSAQQSNNEFSSVLPPQFVGTGTIQQIYKPLTAGNLQDTGYKYGRAYIGTSINRGCYEN